MQARPEQLCRSLRVTNARHRARCKKSLVWLLRKPVRRNPVAAALETVAANRAVAEVKADRADTAVVERVRRAAVVVQAPANRVLAKAKAKDQVKVGRKAQLVVAPTARVKANGLVRMLRVRRTRRAALRAAASAVRAQASAVVVATTAMPAAGVSAQVARRSERRVRPPRCHVRRPNRRP